MTRRGVLILSVLTTAFVLVVTGGVAGRLLLPQHAPTAITPLEPAAEPDPSQPAQAAPPATEDTPMAFAAADGEADDDEHEEHERHHRRGYRVRHSEQREDD